jgi:hypothetical protein
VKFAKYVFLIAGIYGVLVTFPLYFLEARLSVDYPPTLNHPEYYYGFVGVTLAWQFLFFFVARNPVRLRPVMMFCVVEKLSLLPAFLILSPRGLFPQNWMVFMIIDFLLGVLFIVSFRKTKELEAASTPIKS